MEETFKPAFIQRLQKTHFWLLDILPLVVAFFSIPIVYFIGTKPIDWLLFFIMWFLTEVGLELGHHRFFSHQSFKTGDRMKSILTILASINGQGQVLSWVSTHRYHHNFVDTEKDPHSPVAGRKGLRGFLFAHVLWKKSYPLANPDFYAKDLLQDKLVYRVSRKYYWWILLSLLTPALFGGIVGGWKSALVGFLLAGVIRLVICQHSTSLVNSICHMVGQRSYVEGSSGNSRNLNILSILTFGGSLHNNHHSHPSKANNAHKWYDIDPGYWTILLLERLGIVWDVKK